MNTPKKKTAEALAQLQRFKVNDIKFISIIISFTAIKIKI